MLNICGISSRRPNIEKRKPMVLPRDRKQTRTIRPDHILSAVTLSMGVAFMIGIAFSQTRATDFRSSLEKEQIAKHFKGVQRALPPHSVPPPLLDLSKSIVSGTGAGRAWEDRFTGIMGFREITDPGIRVPSEATSIDS
jgi:hypothetical protein